ncbi:hypothetical protein M0R45_026114 [Rubus argutus]|uniref:Uncharacterized protein n=1 Tax=Rubus argutus TaxID=59490 RepID=A0AAW1WWN8_RUBAR
MMEMMICGGEAVMNYGDGRREVVSREAHGSVLWGSSRLGWALVRGGVVIGGLSEMDLDEGEIGSEAVRKGRESCCHGGMGSVVLVIEL